MRSDEPLCKNASAIVVVESEISNQFILTIFSKLAVLRPEVSFNKSEAIALQVQFACQFGLDDVTFHLRSPLHCRTSFTTFGLITSGSGTLSNAHHSSSMLLVINMTVAWGHMNGRNEGGQGRAIPRVPNDCGGHRKVPTMSHVLSSIQYICFRKTSGSNMGTPNLLLAPGAI